MKRTLIASFFFCFLWLVFLFYSSCKKDQGAVKNALCDTLKVTYTLHIQSILQVNCLDPGCHSAGGGTTGIDLSTYALVKPYADNGTLRARVIDGNPSVMPPTGPMPSADLEKIDCWIKDAAPQ